MNEPLFLGMRAAIDLLRAKASSEFDEAEASGSEHAYGEAKMIRAVGVNYSTSAAFLTEKLKIFEGDKNKSQQEFALMQGVITSIQEGLMWSEFGGADTELTQRFQKALNDFVKAVPEMSL